MIASPVCIYRAGRVEEADIVAAWLRNHNIEAQVFDRGSPGLLAFGITDEQGAGVFVTDPAKADDARRLLDEHQRAIHAQRAASAGVAPVEVACEDCGHISRFRLEQRGTVAECGACGAYLDVPI